MLTALFLNLAVIALGAAGIAYSEAKHAERQEDRKLVRRFLKATDHKIYLNGEYLCPAW